MCGESERNLKIFIYGFSFLGWPKSVKMATDPFWNCIRILSTEKLNGARKTSWVLEIEISRGKVQGFRRILTHFGLLFTLWLKDDDLWLVTSQIILCMNGFCSVSGHGLAFSAWCEFLAQEARVLKAKTVHSLNRLMGLFDLYQPSHSLKKNLFCPQNLEIKHGRERGTCIGGEQRGSWQSRILSN